MPQRADLAPKLDANEQMLVALVKGGVRIKGEPGREKCLRPGGQLATTSPQVWDKGDAQQSTKVRAS